MDEPPRFRQSSRKFAPAQRRDMTRAETKLWRALRNHQIDGHGFRKHSRGASRDMSHPLLREAGKVARSAGWGAESRDGSMSVRGDGRASRLALKQRATPHPAFGHLPPHGWRRDHATIVMWSEDGPAAAFSSVVAQVRAGSASQYDEGGNDALARAAKSSDRRVWLS